MRIKCFLIGLLIVTDVLIASAYAGPKIQDWTTSKGTRVYFVEAKGLPLVDVQVLFDAGSARDGDQFGIASLTATLLDKGAGQWNVEEIAQRLEGVGAQLGTDVSRDSALVSLRSLTDSKILDTALETTQKILSTPSFSQKDIDREKNHVLVGLKHLEESPAGIAERAYYRRLYGSHPYGHLSSGSVETVSPISRDDIQTFYKQYYVASNAIIAIVGDVSRDKAASIADYLTQDLAKGLKPESIPKVSYSDVGQSQSIEFPSAQTHIHSGMPVVARGDEDYYALYVGNHVLGGSGLVSRISEEIREKRGLSYSSSSYFFPLRRKGPFTMSLQTRNDQSAEALSVLNQTVEDFIRSGPSEKELVAAKKNIPGGFVLRIDSNDKVANYVAMIGFYGLPLDYLDCFPEKVQSVTRQDITRAFQKHVDVGRFKTILGGGAADQAPKK